MMFWHIVIKLWVNKVRLTAWTGWRFGGMDRLGVLPGTHQHCPQTARLRV